MVLPQKKAISPLLGGSKRCSVVYASMHMYQSGFCAGKGRAVRFISNGKETPEGKRGAGAAC